MSTPKKPAFRARPARPTVSGLIAAAATVSLLGVMTLFVLIPTVFFVLPLSARADAATLCLPGIGPIQQFNEDLEGEYEEVVYIHERVHAEQCRALGAARYASWYGTLEGRLTLEAEALCEEVEVLSLRGADRQRLLYWTVETLMTHYFDEGEIPRAEVWATVDRACGASLAD